MGDSHDKIATRLAIILTKLNDAQSFTIQELSQEFNVSARTIQRDLNRLSFLPIKKTDKRYSLESYALGKLNYKDIKSFATISGIRSLYPSLDDDFIKEILDAKINNVFLIKNQGFEATSNIKSFDTIKKAVLESVCLSFFYKDKKREVNPYRLVNNQGIWYLLADESQKLKNFTVSKIKDLKALSSTFTPNKDFVKTIQENNSNWFSSTSIEVELEIKNEAKEYFLRKQILPNKKIISQDEEKMIVSATLSYDDEVLRLVKYWLPYIKITSPDYLQKKLEKILKKYLQTT